jgi:hypothetical protein
MARLNSKFALVAAGAAALSLAATPAEARGWHRYHHDHDGISAGDVIAGALIIGGIAAIASAASKSNRNRERYDNPPPPPAPRYRDDSYDYSVSPPASDYQTGGINDAVNICVDQVERGDARVASVDNASRRADGWRVSGQLSAGGGFNCWIDNDGRIRRVDFGGDSHSAYNAPAQDGQWSDQAYARAREQADAADASASTGTDGPIDGDLAYAGT